MATGITHVRRPDPYKNFKFQLMWDGRAVAGLSQCSALQRTPSAVMHGDGGVNGIARKTHGHAPFSTVTLERGVTHDAAFGRWASQLGPPLGDAGMNLHGVRQDLVLVLNDERGLPAKRYKLLRCRVTAYQAMPELDAHANATAIHMLQLAMEDWVPDVVVPS